MTPPGDPLDPLLDRLGPEPELPAGLAQKVARRIAQRRRRLSWIARMDAAFARPSFAAAFVAACTLLGLFLAEARLSRMHAEQANQVARDYLQLVDPLFAPSAREGVFPK